MSFIKTMISSIFRTFGRFIAYIIIGAIIYIITSNFVFAKSYKIRLYDLNDSQVVNKDNTNPTDYNGLISSVYINYTNGNQSANNTTYFVMDTTIGIRTCLTDTTLGRVECIPTLDFNKIYWYDTGGTTHDITDSCNISLTKTQTNTTSNNSKLTQWRAITTCTIQSNATLQGFLWNPKITYNLAAKTPFNLNKSAVSINNFDITQDQSEGDLIIANANQNADRIIAAINSSNQEIINQNQEIIIQQEATNQNLTDINDSITDSSVDNPSSALSNMESLVPTNGVVSGILLLPVQLFQAVLNSIDGTCSDFSLGTLYNHNLTMPCINIQNKIGSTLYGVIDILISGLFVLAIRKKFVDIFEHFTSLKTGGNELE